MGPARTAATHTAVSSFEKLLRSFVREKPNQSLRSENGQLGSDPYKHMNVQAVEQAVGDRAEPEL